MLIFCPLVKWAIPVPEEMGVAGKGEVPGWVVGVEGRGEAVGWVVDGRGRVVALDGCTVGWAGEGETVGVDRNDMPCIQLHDNRHSTAIESDSHLKKG